MQIGWATKSTSFKNHEGSGVGDDAHSIAFDGCRRVIWHNMTNYEHNLPLWNAGDIVGCLIDFTKKKPKKPNNNNKKLLKTDDSFSFFFVFFLDFVRFRSIQTNKHH